MSKTEILAELPKLNAKDRAQVFQRLCELQEKDLINRGGPTAEEKKLLDRALMEYKNDGDTGTLWRQALRQIRNSKKH